MFFLFNYLNVIDSLVWRWERERERLVDGTELLLLNYPFFSFCFFIFSPIKQDDFSHLALLLSLGLEVDLPIGLSSFAIQKLEKGRTVC